LKSIEYYWQDKNAIAWLLLPISWLYCLLVIVRRLFYRTGLFSSSSFQKTVVVVGNITVGGSGKTPLIIAMTEMLRDAGIKAGIVSRGYAGKQSSQNEVTPVLPDSDPLLVGDEPLLMARQTQVPVFVGRQRAAVVKALIKQHPELDVVLSDDGLQHYAMQRDLEIVVFDVDRGLGNGWCLPAGPLRERPGRLNEVDIVVKHSAGPSADMHLQGSTLHHLITDEKMSVAVFKDTSVHAVAGIGSPDRFFKQLQSMGLKVIPHPFPDHYLYQRQHLMFNDDLPIIMTEKDAVKCTQLFKATDSVYYLPVKAVLAESVAKNILQQIKSSQIKSNTGCIEAEDG